MNFVPLQLTSAARIVIPSALALLTVACAPQPSNELEKAKERINAADSTTAIIHLKGALAQDANLHEARLLLGLALIRTGDPTGAAVELEKALAAGLPRKDVVPGLAIALLRSGKGRSVIERFEDEELDEPAQAASLRASLAAAYLEIGKVEAGDAAIADALRLQPNLGPALLLKASRLVSERQAKQAAELLTQHLTRSPKDLQALLMLAIVQQNELQDAPAALATLHKAIEHEPRFIEAHKALILTHLAANDVDKASAQLEKLKSAAPKHSVTRYLQALVAHSQRNFNEARSLLEPLLRAAPSDPNVNYLAGMIEHESGALLKAEAYLGKVLHALPDQPQVRILLASTYLRQGRMERVSALLDPVLNEEAPPPAALALRADLYLQQGDLAKAEALYTRAAALAPKSTQLQVNVATVQVGRGKVEPGLKALESLAAESRPGDEVADMALFTARTRLKDLDGALEVAERLIKRRPQDANAIMLKAGVMELKGDATAAFSLIEQAIRLAPDNYRAVSRAAAYDAHRGNLDAGVQRYAQFLKSVPNHAAAQLDQLALTQRQGLAPKEATKQLMAIAEGHRGEVVVISRVIAELQELQAQEQANELARALAATSPNDPRAQVALGNTQLASGKPGDAARTFRKVLGMAPQDPYATYRLAEAQAQAGQRAEAFQTLKRLLEDKPNHLAGQRALVGLHLVNKDFAAALAQAKLIQKQRPNADIGHLLEGDVEAKQKNWGAAERSYREALKRQATGEVAAKLYQVLSAGSGQQSANDFASRWRKDHSNDATFAAHLADQALTAKRFEEAANLYDEVTKLQPMRPSAWTGKALAAAEIKRADAMPAAQRAVELAPQTPASHHALAKAQFANGSFAEAVRSQQRAVELSQQDPTMRLELGRLLLAAGQRDAARKELKALQQLGVDFPGKQEVNRLLER